MKSTSFLFIFLGLFFAQNAFCQDFSTLQWGVYVTPTYNNVLYTGKHPEYMNDLKEYIKPTFGYVVGTNVAYRLNENIGFETGLSFQKKGLNYDIEDKKLSATDRFSSINIPLKINYYFGNSNLSFITSFGVDVNYTISYKGLVTDIPTKQQSEVNITFEYYTNNNPLIPRNHRTYSVIPLDSPLSIGVNYNKFHITPFLSFGINYKLNDKVSMRVEPVVRYDMFRSEKDRFRHIDIYFAPSAKVGNTTIDNDFAKDHIWSVGLNTALYFNL